jgi:plasmid stability protein
MTLTIQLPEEVEHRLRHEAETHGLDAEAYVQRLIVSRFTPERGGSSVTDTAPAPEEQLRTFEAYLAGLDRSGPPLPPEAFHRESFYGDRG